METILKIIKQEYGKSFDTYDTLRQMHIIKSVAENYIWAIHFLKNIKLNTTQP